MAQSFYILEKLRQNKGNKTRNPSSLKARIWIYLNLFESILNLLNLFESIESIWTQMVPENENRDNVEALWASLALLKTKHSQNKVKITFE